MKRAYWVVGYLLAMWFVISFVTNIIGPLMPEIIKDFGLNFGLAAFLPFAFFVAYGVASIPAGMLVERVGAKRTMALALAVNLCGALPFAAFPSYLMAVCGLFVIGVGMAMLQVVINPMMRTAGGEEHFAFFSVLGQLVFGLASFVSPLTYTALMTRAAKAPGDILFSLAPKALPWVSFYWLFAALFLAALVLTLAMRIPEVELKEDERAGGWEVHKELLSQPMVWLFFLGIAAYVATEQSLANWMSQFLATYHQVSPLGEGAAVVGRFWGLMAVGCAVGLVLLKLLDSRKVLCGATLLAMATLLLALFGGREASVIAFAMMGFFLSVMFSIVFSLALNSVPRHHGAFSGILCSGILGGALGPLAVGALGDQVGLRSAMLLILGTLSYLFFIGAWARPLIANATLGKAEQRPVPAEKMA